MQHPPSSRDQTPLTLDGNPITHDDVLERLGEGNVEDFVDAIKELVAAGNGSESTPSVRPASPPPIPKQTPPTTSEPLGASRIDLLYSQANRQGSRQSENNSTSPKRDRPEEPPHTDPHVRKRKRIHVPPPTAVYVATEHSLDFDVPDYASFNADQRVLARANLERSAQRIFKIYPHLPEILVKQDISPTFLRRIYIQIHNRSLATQSESWAERGRVVLLFGFSVLEVGMTYLGFGKEFASKVASGRFMCYFDEELSAIGDMMTAKTGGKKMGNPFMRIAMYTGMNVLFFLGVRLLAWVMPAQAAEGFLNFLIDTFLGVPTQKNAGPQRPPEPTDAPQGAPRPTTSFMGMDASSFMTSAASAIGGMLNSSEPRHTVPSGTNSMRF